MANRKKTGFRKVRFGVIGAGGMGEAHIRCIQDIEEADLVAVCDVECDVARDVGRKNGVPYYTDYRKLVREAGVEAVTVGTPHFAHPVICTYAMNHGVHVLTEKPIGVRVGRAERAAKTAKKTGMLYTAMFQQRTTPAVRGAIDIVKRGKLGEIHRTLLIATGLRSQSYYDSAEWRATWTGEGGGVLVNQAPHPLDVFTALAGLPRHVTAVTRTRIHRIEVEDEAEALLEYANGARGYVHVSTTEAPGTRLIEVCGDKGKLVLRDGQLEFFTIRPGLKRFVKEAKDMWGGPTVKKEKIKFPKCESGHKAVVRNFARAIRKKEKLLIDGSLGLPSLELANAIIMSGATGRTVRLPISRRGYDRLIADLQKKSKPKKLRGPARRETDPQHKSK